MFAMTSQTAWGLSLLLALLPVHVAGLTMHTTADDTVEVFADGVSIGYHGNLNQVLMLDLPEDIKVIGLKAVNTGGLSGIVARLSSGHVTNEKVKCTADSTNGAAWSTSAYEDSGWPAAKEVCLIGECDVAVYNLFAASMPGAQWIWSADPNDDIVYCRLTNLTCREDDLGEEYMGVTRTTLSGLTCQRWDSQTPHTHTMTQLDAFPGELTNLSQVENFCRNPDGSGRSGGPWCYTTEPGVEWEYCDTPYCDVTCREDDLGEEYMGVTRTTLSGLTCQRWDSQTPHTHTMTQLDAFPGELTNLSQVENFCRNPDGSGRSGGPWCYTTEPGVEWEYCDTPYCDAQDIGSDLLVSREMFDASQLFDGSSATCQEVTSAARQQDLAIRLQVDLQVDVVTMTIVVKDMECDRRNLIKVYRAHLMINDGQGFSGNFQYCELGAATHVINNVQRCQFHCDISVERFVFLRVMREATLSTGISPALCEVRLSGT